MAATLRWGIASAGMISGDFTNALQMAYSEGNTIKAVGARTLEKAQEFAQKFGLPKAYGSYQELANDPDIDVVYIGAVHVAHYELCEMMLTAGKHVLCEKPITINARQLQDILAIAKRADRFFMEGVWSRFFPGYARLREELAAGALGDLRSVIATFGADCIDVPRSRDPAVGGGALLDIGIYPVQLFTMIFGEMPERIVASATLTKEGVDANNCIACYYKSGAVAVSHVSTLVKLPNTATICGTKGSMEIGEPFWAPTKLTTPAKTHEFPLPKAPRPMHYSNSEGFCYEIKCVRECILKGEKSCPIMPLEHSLINMQIMDEVRRQIGVVYEQDK